MSLTRIGSIGINTGIAFAGVTTIVTLNTANDALSIGSTVNVGSGITLGASGDIFATGVCTATSFVGSGANLTGVASTENIRTNTNATFLQNINVSGSTTTGSLVSSGAISGTTGTFTGDVDIADKIIHTGDTNTAIRFPEADTITFETTGFEQVRINNDVQMFIEGDSKQVKLQLHREDVSIDAGDVVGQITFTGRDAGGAGVQRVGAAISAVASNNWDTSQTTGYSATHLDFYTQAQQGAYSTLTPRLRIDSSGRVLIGTTSELFSQNDKLQIADTSAAAGIIVQRAGDNANPPYFHFHKTRNASVGGNTIVQSGDELGRIRWNAANGSGINYAAEIRGYVDGTPGASNDMPGRIAFYTTPDGSGTPVERLRINSSGQVMIGTDTPTSNQAAQALTIALQNSGNTGITLRSGTGGGDTNEGSIFFSDATSGAGEYAGYLQYSHASNYFRIGVNSVERVRITSDGYFGIGMTPAAPLHVTGSTADTLRLTNGSNTSIYYKIGRNHLDGKLEFRGTQSGDEAYSFGGVSGEKIRFQPAGGISFNGDTAAANALDDYEEGTVTFAPVNTGISFSSSYKGRYTKIGELVTVSGYIVVSSVTSSGATLNVQMPFTSAANSEGYYTRGVGAVFYKYINTPTDQPNLVAYVGGGENYMRFYSSGDNTDWHQTTHSQVSTSTHIYFNICYTTTA